ncbi:MAG: carboxypeptidase-like regulatory domain-containing protein [Bacteroidales bacterium]
MRTTDKTITIDTLYFKPGEKLIFSIDEQYYSSNQGKIIPAKMELSSFERGNLQQYVFPYRENFGESFAYIEHNGVIELLNPGKGSWYGNFKAGPVSGPVNFSMMDQYNLSFNHEAGFEYEFAPNLLKMRSTKSYDIPKTLWRSRSDYRLNDSILSLKALHWQWNEYKENKRMQSFRYSNPGTTTGRNSRICLNFLPDKGVNSDKMIHFLLFSYDDNIRHRVYPGNIGNLQDIKAGWYKFFLIYKGGSYYQVDSVEIRPGGLNYLEIEVPDFLRKDTMSVYIMQLVEKILLSRSYSQMPENGLNYVNNLLTERPVFNGEGRLIEGIITDENGEPVIGANVLCMEKARITTGTVSNLDGRFSLKIPGNTEFLTVSFIGYETQRIVIGNSDWYSVQLKESTLALNEVVVMGYGIRPRDRATATTRIELKDMHSAGTIPVEDMLQGRVSGISISGDPGSGKEIRIRGISAIESGKSPLIVLDGVIYNGKLEDINQDIIENIELLKDNQSTSIYGSKGANGVILITTKNLGFKQSKPNSNKGAEFDAAFLEAASQSSSIRENFSDYAFWKPRLITDKEGKASFDVTFPDDITSWKTYYLAMNEDLQTGQTDGLIKSYKPLMAQLAIPRFLVESDTSKVIGKTLNYTPDTVLVKTHFEVNNQPVLSRESYCINAVIDTLELIAGKDSFPVKYYLEDTTGYFDGELRYIPVFPSGLEETRGAFHVLDKDTTFIPQFDSALGKVKLYATADVLLVIESEISHLIHYLYGCNEQLASKLKALLAEKSIAEYRKKDFKSDREVKKLINLLVKNKKENGLWGWWKDSDPNLWISVHVLEALLEAENKGYASGLNKNEIIASLIWELEHKIDFDTQLRSLRILYLMKAQVDFKKYFDRLYSYQQLSFNSTLRQMEIKQLFHMPLSLDTLNYYKKNTLFGSIYFSDNPEELDILSNDVQNTLLAYKLLRNDSVNHDDVLRKIRTFFFENRCEGYWRNTFESAQIIETILPDILKNGGSELTKSKLEIRGTYNQTVTKFPFEYELNGDDSITITKTGEYPVFLTHYQRSWNSNPVARKNQFEIVSAFQNEPDGILTAGKETKLIVKVNLKKDVKYVMINIPVPGGCSYGEKNSKSRYEEHREYFRNEVALFCSSLPKGQHSFEINILPRFSGSYTLNPARVELMYFPTFSANNETKHVKIR